MTRVSIPIESLIILHNKLSALPARHPSRITLQKEVSASFGVSVSTVRRCLRAYQKPHLLKRSDFNKPRKISGAEMQKYCELIAALKIRTTNKKGRHLSTPRAIWILENHGVEVDGIRIVSPRGVLTKSTVNRFLKRQGFSPRGLKIEPVAVRFQAEKSNECWQIDFTWSELKKLPTDSVHSPEKKLLLASVVDDRSGVSYQEYFLCDGENSLIALRFLFNAMSAKKHKDFPFQGIPEMVYMDNGPAAKSLVFQRVLELLGVTIVTHLPQNSDGRRTTARSKGKVERPFRTIQDGFETLYHFHQPRNLDEANDWLWNYLRHYNSMSHRSEDCSRLEDWKRNLPPEGYRQMCSWDRFCQISREPSERRVGCDARVSIDGIFYQLPAEMAGETVTILYGLFDQEIYLEFLGEKQGPFHPAHGPIPLYTYRSFKKTIKEQKLDDVTQLAKKLAVPKSVMNGFDHKETLKIIQQSQLMEEEERMPFVPFPMDNGVEESHFKNLLEAKLAIASLLGRPLATLHGSQRQQLDIFMGETLHKRDLLHKVQEYFRLRLHREKEG